MPNKVVIIIVTYNGMQWLPTTLVSIPEQYHVIVVDNNSSDETVNYIQQNFKAISLYPQSKNLGFGGGNNLGISYALKESPDYIFLLNQDAYLGTDTIDNLIKAHKLNTNYGILSPIHLSGTGKELDWNFSTYLTKESLQVVTNSLETKTAKEIHNVLFVNAAAWLLPIKTVNTVGGFDPIFFHYGEDNNYCQRVLYHNYSIGVVMGAFVKHDRNSSITKANWTIEKALKKRERELKVKWGDINIKFLKQHKKRKRKLYNKLCNALIKFNMADANYRKAEIKLINTIVPEIVKSRTTNKLKGRHYINEL